MSEVVDEGPRGDNPPPWISPVSYWIPSHIVESAWLRHGSFAAWIVGALRPRTLVELGTHNGFSYFTFVEAARRLGLDMRSWAVDTWEGDEHAGFYGDEIFELVSGVNEPYEASSTLVRGYFADQLDRFDDGSIDLLHIDGRHRYEDVREDFELYLPKVSDRGVVLFHDIAETSGDFGVYRLWDEIASRYPSYAFSHEHGLGVLFVGAKLAPDLETFLEVAGTEASSIQSDYERLGSEISAYRDRQRMLRDAMTQVSERDAEIVRLEADIVRLGAELVAMRQSRSWKVTAPLRRLRGGSS